MHLLRSQIRRLVRIAPKTTFITGGICSGKSHFTSRFKSRATKVIDCDVVVQGLYDIPLVQHKLNATFGVSSKQEIIGLLSANPKLLTKLQNILCPFLGSELVKVARKTPSSKQLFIEIPLFFELGLHQIRDIRYIIISTTRRKQLSRLQSRVTHLTPLHKYILKQQFSPYKKRSLKP